MNLRITTCEALLSFLLVSCGVGRPNDHFPGIGSIAEAPPVKSGTDGSGTISFGDGSTGYTSTTGGYLKVSSVTTYTLPSTETFYGISADSTNYYTFIKRNAGNSVFYWDVQSSALGQTSFTTKCSLLDDGKFTTGLALDSSNFYTFYGATNDVKNQARQFSRSSCAEGSKLTITSSGYYTDENMYRTTDLSLDQGALYFFAKNPYPSGSNPVHILGQTTMATPTFRSIDIFSLSIAGETVNTGNGLNLAASNGNVWVLATYYGSSGGGCGSVSEAVLWKFAISSTEVVAVGWAKLPTGTYANLCYSGFMAASDANTLLLGTYDSSNKQLSIFQLDVSKF